MKIIICGAGQVGSQIARHLSREANDVTIVDQDAGLVRRVTDSFDVNGIVGFASHPDVLERAGAEDADMLIAATFADEVNMVACQVAHSVFSVPQKIARIRAQSYLQNRWADLFRRDHMPIDVVISPELEVARVAMRLSPRRAAARRLAPGLAAGRRRRLLCRRRRGCHPHPVAVRAREPQGLPRGDRGRRQRRSASREDA